MTEDRWLAGTDPRAMLTCVRGQATDRKLRLVCAACWRVSQWLGEPHGAALRAAAELAERLADDPEAFSGERRNIRLTPWGSAWAIVTSLRAESAGARLCCHTLRDLFGNPFRPSRWLGRHPTGAQGEPPAWLAWNGRTIPRLAQAIYDERRFEDLPVLGDALEEAGCTEEAILTHCRQRGEHVRGCFLVDTILGKS